MSQIFFASFSFKMQWVSVFWIITRKKTYYSMCGYPEKHWILELFPAACHCVFLQIDPKECQNSIYYVIDCIVLYHWPIASGRSGACSHRSTESECAKFWKAVKIFANLFRTFFLHNQLDNPSVCSERFIHVSFWILSEYTCLFLTDRSIMT